ncbi:hypothetical protein P3T40_002950 [Paraburkholderia sp. EB58]|uniref:hypothetical protein n=1 Tax=Paraburkholderia sp. EB58 TaxID=3035125 RepID=UPI003D1CAE54
MIFNPWTTRFENQWTDEAIDAVVEVPALPLHLEALSADVGAEVLRCGLERIFVSGGQARWILRQLIDILYSHAQSHFVSEEAYMRGLYDSDPWGQAVPPAICLTGLAGVGKSELIWALQKLIGAPTLIDVPGHTGISLVPGWFLTLKNGVELSQLLRPWVMSDQIQNTFEDGESEKGRIKNAQLMKSARRRSWRDGVCFLVVDEFQFITLGSEANARATLVLLKLQGLGPRLIYVANYSLVHRLKKRGHEDRDRLLQKPIIVQPEVRSSTDWIRLLHELKKVSPEVLTFDVDASQEQVHQYTFGLKRAVVRLIVIAFRVWRSKGGRHGIGADELSHAYRSVEYSTCREDVEALWQQQIQGKLLRPDLWCPFSDFDNTENVSLANQAIESFRKRVDGDYLKSSLSPSEAAALRSIEEESTEKKARGQVVCIPRQKVTKQSLLEGSERFDKLRR